MQIDPNVPTNIPDSQLHDVKGFLDLVLEGILGDVTPEILQAGDGIWTGLAVVIIVWTGLRIAFSGDFQAWSVIQMIMGLMIPATMLHYYDTPIPGTSRTFPQVVVAQGAWVQEMLLADTVSASQAGIGAAIQSTRQKSAAAWGEGSWWSWMGAKMHEIMTQFVAMIVMTFIVLIMLGLFVITYAQVLWAQVAGAILRVFMGIGLGYLSTFSQSTFTLDDMGTLVMWSLILLPLAIAGILAALKVGEISSLLVSGAGATGSGLVGVVMMAATGGKAIAARGAGAAMKGK